MSKGYAAWSHCGDDRRSQILHLTPVAHSTFPICSTNKSTSAAFRATPRGFSSNEAGILMRFAAGSPDWASAGRIFFLPRYDRFKVGHTNVVFPGSFTADTQYNFFPGTTASRWDTQTWYSRAPSPPTPSTTTSNIARPIPTSAPL